MFERTNNKEITGRNEKKREHFNAQDLPVSYRKVGR